MTARGESDYVLGTHADEVARLGLQHRVWRSVVTECWERVGLTNGWRVIDVGAGRDGDENENDGGPLA